MKLNQRKPVGYETLSMPSNPFSLLPFSAVLGERTEIAVLVGDLEWDRVNCTIQITNIYTSTIYFSYSPCQCSAW
jgi:hypothetical protein